MRRSLKVVGALLGVVAALTLFGNWKQSPLHRYVCGPQTPYPYNLRWMMNGYREIDNWPARFCGCKPPPGYTAEDEWQRILARTDRVWKEQPESMRQLLAHYGFEPRFPK